MNRTALAFAFGLAFVAIVYALQGSHAAIEFVAAYLLAYAIAFETTVVLQAFRVAYHVPHSHYRRLQLYSVAVALLVRTLGLFIASYLVRRFDGLVYVFAIYLIYLVTQPEASEVDQSRSGLVAEIPVYELALTLDSIAVFAVTRSTFIAVSACLAAALAVRAATTLVDAWRPKRATSVLFVVAAVGLVTHEYVRLNLVAWLLVIASVFAVGFAGAMLATRRR
jgi:predicted tellurium resistance membrane protein TerC